MPQSTLPDPQAAGPIAGAPGHFAHHDWLEAAAEALDQIMGWRSMALQVGPSIAQSVANATFAAIRLDTAVGLVVSQGSLV